MSSSSLAKTMLMTALAAQAMTDVFGNSSSRKFKLPKFDDKEIKKEVGQYSKPKRFKKKGKK